MFFFLPSSHSKVRVGKFAETRSKGGDSLKALVFLSFTVYANHKETLNMVFIILKWQILNYQHY